MSSTVSLGAFLNLSLGALSGVKEAQKSLSRMFGAAADTGTTQGIEGAARALQPSMRKLYASGMREPAKALRKEYEKIGQKAATITREMVETQRAIRAATDAQVKAELKDKQERLKQRLGMERNAQKKLLEAGDKAAKERMDLIEAHEERMRKSRTESATEAGESFKNVMEKTLSGGFDPSSMMEGLAKALSGGLTARAGATAAAGGATAGAEVAGLTAAAGSIAAVAAPIAAIVALMAAAYGQQKEMNKALMSNVSAADMGTKSGDRLNDTLSNLRQTSTDLAYEFRMTKEEVMGTITAMNEAGMTVQEFRGFVTEASDDMDAYGQVARLAVVASRGLGVSTSEVADFTNKMYRDMGANLNDIQGAFGMIYDEAGKAGMSTKDFFATINETSAGMALYNFRLGDTVGLMTDMVKILGEDLAKTSIKMEGTFKGMGMQDRIKNTMLSGGKFGKVVQADAKSQAKVFNDMLKANKITGIGAQDVGTLGKMGAKEFRKMLAGIGGENAGDVEAAKRKLVSLREVSQGAKGGTMNIANALGGLSKSGELAAQLSQGFGMIGKPLSEATAFDKMVLQETTGMGAEQIDILSRLDMGLRAEYEQMVRDARDGKAGVNTEVLGQTFEEALASGLLSQGEAQAEADKASYLQMEQAARASYKATTGIGQTLSNIIAGLLERIAQGIDWMLKIFGDSSMFDADAGAIKERSASFERQGKAREELGAIGENLAVLTAKKQFVKTEEEKAAVQKEIDALTERKRAKEAEVEGESDVQSRLGAGKAATAGEARSQALAEKHKATVGNLTPDQLRAAGLGDLVEKAQRTSGGAGGGGRAAAAGVSMAGLDLPKEFVSLNSLTAEQAKTLDDMLTKQEAADLEQKIRDTKLTDVNSEGFKSLETVIKEMTANAAQTTLGNMLGKKGQSIIEQANIKGTNPYSALYSMLKEDGEVSEGEKMLLAQAGFQATTSSPKNDFIYSGNGRTGNITPINSLDSFYGAKPGGPVDRGSRGGGNATFNIYGDEARIYAVVKKVMTEIGFKNMKSYSP